MMDAADLRRLLDGVRLPWRTCGCGADIRNDDEEHIAVAREVADAALIVAAVNAAPGLLAFVAAFDAWAESSELCGGFLFDVMLDARAALFPERDR